VHALTLPAGLSRLLHEEPYHFIYADPPHRMTDYAPLLDAIRMHGLLAADGMLVIEHATRTEMPEEIGAFARVRQAKYGATTLSFFQPHTASR
jgi:16S rRNA (guanine966-N2)-methyltransferase